LKHIFRKSATLKHIYFVATMSSCDMPSTCQALSYDSPVRRKPGMNHCNRNVNNCFHLFSRTTRLVYSYYDRTAHHCLVNINFFRREFVRASNSLRKKQAQGRSRTFFLFSVGKLSYSGSLFFLLYISFIKLFAEITERMTRVFRLKSFSHCFVDQHVR
jgi:hypothetical protein